MVDEEKRVAEGPVKRSRPVRRLRVLRKDWLTPHMVRIVFGAEGLPENGFTDRYVKLLFPPPGVRYPEPLDVDAVRRDRPRAEWPRQRTYTVRAYDPDSAELTIDFVYHGDEGLAGPWASAAEPGDEIMAMGPGGAYAPGQDADWQLLVGDESALPAIAAALEAMPAGVPVRAVVQVADEGEQQKLTTPGELEITWLYRDGGAADVLAAVRSLDFPPGRVQAFVHGEAGFVSEVRRYLLRERGVDRDLLSVSGYWRLGKDDEAWRVEKAEQRRLEESEQGA